ncbi:hypothetical protein NK718_02785 [Alsobacter sp. SYSU M60028]|uniref:Uncharacterized protein n=1 Tax=Alsobacter ponti TaxID=2962936 RepID=A0ABT1L7I9_9HYPH|nr:hypothetical protein [Alsobacter ponti]MCP8937429.1 hypothetical protein [Alsobacter ponti]
MKLQHPPVQIDVLRHAARLRGLVLAAALAAATPTLAETLITPEEAALPPAAETELTLRGLTRGPGVEQVSPAPTSLASPFAFKVRFTPRNQVPIDLSSVHVTYVKANDVDITARLKPFVTQGGIEMGTAQAPPGEHVLRVDVKDAQGRASSTLVRLSIAP